MFWESINYITDYKLCLCIKLYLWKSKRQGYVNQTFHSMHFSITTLYRENASAFTLGLVQDQMKHSIFGNLKNAYLVMSQAFIF